MKRNRVIATTVIGSVLLGAFAFLPLPFHVDCAMEVQPENATQVFAMVPGHLVKFNKKPGDQVEAGEAIAELDNNDVRLQVTKTWGELQVADQKLKGLQQSVFKDSQALALMQVSTKVVQSKTDLYNKALERVALLTVKAPISGTIIPPPNKPDQRGAAEAEQLPSWSGNPFAPKNAEAYFAQSDLLCLIGEPTKMEAVLVIDQADIDLVDLKDPVDMKIESARLDTFSGIIKTVSSQDMQSLPENLASQASGGVDTEMDPSGRLKPMSTSYQARVPLENVKVPLRPGYRGYAKIYVGWKSLGWRFYRFLARTFRFEM